MAQQVWMSPTDSNPKHALRIDDSLTGGIVSPAPAGQTRVPVGWILQLGVDGFMDTGPYQRNGVPVPNITVQGLPYYVGTTGPGGGYNGVIGYDPQAGQPFHTAPNVNRKDGIND